MGAFDTAVRRFAIYLAGEVLQSHVFSKLMESSLELIKFTLDDMINFPIIESFKQLKGNITNYSCLITLFADFHYEKQNSRFRVCIWSSRQSKSG